METDLWKKKASVVRAYPESTVTRRGSSTGVFTSLGSTAAKLFAKPACVRQCGKLERAIC